MEKAKTAKRSPSMYTVATEDADDDMSAPPTVTIDAQPTASEDDG